MTGAISSAVKPSARFVKTYASDFELIFYVGAKSKVSENEITGPRVFRKAKHVEYSVFLPFKVIARQPNAPEAALEYLFKAVCEVLESLEIDPSRVVAGKDDLIDEICSDRTMFDDESFLGPC